MNQDPATALFARLSAVVTDRETVARFVSTKFPGFVKPKVRT